MEDWYQIKEYKLDNARTNFKITDFPEDGDCILVLLNEDETLSETYIRFNSPTAHQFDIYKYRRLRYKVHTLWLTNVASAGNKIRLLIGKGDWDVERVNPQDEMSAVNADTVDNLHARRY